MAAYRAPVKDMNFVLHEVFEANKLWSSLQGLQDVVDPDTGDAILNEAAKLMEQAIAPLSREADEQGAHWDNGVVTAPEGFKEAYGAFVEGGWSALGGNPNYGGMGMPKMLTAQVEEMMQGACMSFGLLPMLTAGACLSIDAHASDELKQKYLPNMYAGTWSGAMDLTEPHAGTDLGIIRTKAVENGDGSYAITGTKIFITWGEHDVAENIVHLVLAKLPDAPAGPKGISMFLVPKFLVNDDGTLGERNGAACGSIEGKMGIKGSATCVMNYDNATGWLVGELNQGLACMFTMMNYERLGVGIQALGAADASYQNAVEYANERLQSRSPGGPQEKDKAADPIIVHPDVRRMLMDMRTQTEGARAFSTYVAKWLDLAKYSDDEDERNKADALAALLTPVAKAFVSDKALESCVAGQQVFGGHGFIREWGQEQLVRDVRITQIYEGTNGIQAMDLIGRKVIPNGGKYLAVLFEDMQQFIDQHGSEPATEEFISPLREAIETTRHCAETIISQSQDDPFAAGAAANDFLHLLGLTCLAYMWVMMASAAAAKQNNDDDFYHAKIASARYFFARQLPLIEGLRAKINSGSESVMSMQADWF